MNDEQNEEQTVPTVSEDEWWEQHHKTYPYCPYPPLDAGQADGGFVLGNPKTWAAKTWTCEEARDYTRSLTADGYTVAEVRALVSIVY